MSLAIPATGQAAEGDIHTIAGTTAGLSGDGGAGNDRLVGGPGPDLLSCGAGKRDVAIGTAEDRIKRSCEKIIRAG